jgi:hypothetical protein
MGLVHVPHTILLEELQVVRLYWPIEHTEHATQAADTFMPTPVEYFPVWHALQFVLTGAPETVEYVPWTQFRQVALMGAPIVVE